MIKRILIFTMFLLAIIPELYGQALLGMPPKLKIPPMPASPEQFGRNWIRTFGSNDGLSQQEGRKLVRDHGGNFIVIGFTTSENFGTDPLVLKYDPDGNLLWSARYTSAVNGNNKAVDVVVNSNNDIYITGYVYVGASYFDLLTVKFTSSGGQLWSRTFDGDLHGWDEAYAITIDPSGNICISGSVAATDETADLVVIKYDSQGNELWNYLFDGGENGWAYGEDILTDDAGNVYVAGYNWNDGYDLLLLKISSAGEYLWDTMYDNAGNDEEGVLLAINSAGDILVNGAGVVDGGFNYLIVSFDPQGNINWQSYHTGSYALYAGMTLDDHDNIYQAGGTQYRNGDALVVKYDSSGTQLWDTSYDSGENNGDVATCVTVDDSGNVLAAGYQNVTVGAGLLGDEIVLLKYTAAGDFVWSAVPDTLGTYSHAKDIILDTDGNAVLTGFNAYPRDVDIASFDPDGNQIFHSDFSGEFGSYDQANALIISPTGDIILGGTTSSQNVADFLTVKYDQNGNYQWKAEFDGNAHLDDAIWAVATDDNGNVYVSGASETENNIRDIVTIKYDPDGNELWQAHYDGFAQLSDVPVDMKVDSEGDIYVCGYSDVNENYSRAVILIKYSSSGSLLWEKSLKGTYPDGNDKPVKLDFDSQGNIYIISWLTDMTDGDINYDYGLSKFSPSGDSLWTVKYNGTANGNDYPEDFCIGSDDDIYVTGFSLNAEDSNEILTIEYNPDGEQQWIAEYDSSLGGSYGDQGQKLMTDQDGNVYVGGIGFHNSYDTDIILIKYDASGEEQWSTIYAKPDRPESGDLVQGMEWMDDGSIFIAGGFATTYPYYSMQNLKFSREGELLYIDGYQMLTSPTEVLTSSIGCAKASNGDIVVAGNSMANYWKVISLLSFSNNPTGFAEQSISTPQSFSLSQNYPNPFNPSTNIQFEIPTRGMVSLKIYDVQGREVAALVHKPMQPGRYEFTWNAQGFASGIYFYRLSTDQSIKIRKMILLR